MELNHLKYFYFVAKEGGFTKASKALKIAQPAITKMVKNLESELDTHLFDRVGKTVRLTKIGNDIYRKCELIFGHVEDIKSINKKSRGEVRGPLRIAAVEPIANHLVPDLLLRLLKDHSKIYPHIVTGTAGELCRILSEGKADVALLFHTPDLSEDLEFIATFPVGFKLVVAAEKKHDVKVCSSFIGSREVDDVANRKYPTLAKLQKIYPDAEIRISTNSLSSHLPLVLSGLGVSILPEFIVHKDLATNRLATLLDHEVFKFNLKVVARKNVPLLAGSQTFLKLLADTSPTLYS
jgi:DNA-binding transcriptional LysR family regulator